MSIHTDPIGAMSKMILDLSLRVANLEAKEARRSKLKESAKASAHPDPSTAKTISDLLRIAAEKFDIPPALIGSESRYKHIVLARDWVIFEASKQGKTGGQIAMSLGRDTSSINTAIQRERKRRAAQ